MNAVENWKDVVGYEGLYQVSDAGRVRSLNFNKQKGNVQLLKPQANTHGYLQVNLKRRLYAVARLVAQAFIPPIDGKPEVDHIDRDKSNNRIENLRWADRTDQNINRDYDLGVTGERNIVFGNGKYRLKVCRNYITYNAYFSTLPEAVVARDNYLASI